MPVYDYRCNYCGHIELDVYEPVNTPKHYCRTRAQTMCPGDMERAWLPGKAASVIGDEIDIEIKHGLCHNDGSPRRFRSREELARVAKAKGWESYVVHRGTKDGDRSTHTSRWV